MHNRVFGLIGKPVKHSFSEIYFEEKFRKSGLTDCRYKLFELQSINDLPDLLKSEPFLEGLNVTSPYKTEIFKFLSSKSVTAQTIGAVNTVKIKDKQLYGYNTDWKGFIDSLKSKTNITKIHSALILGTGGAAKSTAFALKSNNIKCTFVSRKTFSPLSFGEFNTKNTLSYKDLNNSENFDCFDLIVNATPCGMQSYPDIAEINTDKITAKHIVFDLIYNPEKTLLLTKAEKQGAKTINGLEMLHLQAEESWKIFNGKI